MAHVNPDNLRDAMTAAGLDVAAVARASGLSADFLTDALAGSRRLDGWAMRALAGPVAVEWHTLRCERAAGARRCAACGASHLLTADDLAPLADAIRHVLDAMYSDGRSPADISAAASAATALRTVGGGDLDAVWAAVEHLSPHRLEASGGTEAVARRLAAYVARGDADTVELIGLDIDLPPGLEVAVAGWTLGRLDADIIADFDPIPAQPASAWWDRDAAALTAWLRRPAGVRPAVSRTATTISEPRGVAASPLLALTIVGEEPPGALSHAWAQPGRGVRFAATSRELDYFRHTDGYLDATYGPYRVRQGNVEAWAQHLERVGHLVARAFAASGNSRFTAAAEQMLTIAADFHLGWNPLPRLALEMSTLLEILVLNGGNTGEPTRRVTLATAWLGGVDDDDRAAVAAVAKTMYGAGSAYRHGGSRYTLHHGGARPAGKNVLDIDAAYRLLRRLLLHGAAVLAAGENIAELCDRAQLSDAARQRLMSVITDQYAALGQSPAPFRR